MVYLDMEKQTHMQPRGKKQEKHKEHSIKMEDGLIIFIMHQIRIWKEKHSRECQGREDNRKYFILSETNKERPNFSYVE